MGNRRPRCRRRRANHRVRSVTQPRAHRGEQPLTRRDVKRDEAGHSSHERNAVELLRRRSSSGRSTSVRAALPLTRRPTTSTSAALPVPEESSPARLPDWPSGPCRAPPQRLQTAVVPVSIKPQEPADVDRPSPQESRERGTPQRPPSLARPTREWRTHWRAAFASTSFPLQIGPSVSSLRIRVRRFDSCRGHSAPSSHGDSLDSCGTRKRMGA
jgi:hypothetical protein